MRTGNPPTTPCSSGTAHVVLGSGLTIAGAMLCLQLHPAAVLPDHGRAVRDRHARRGCRRADAGAGGDRPRQPFGLFEPKRNIALPRVAPCRHRGGPLAGTHPGRDGGARPGRSARPSRLQDDLRPSPLPPRRHADQCRLCRRRPPFRRRPDESGTAPGRKRSRPAELRRLPGDRQDRQGGVPGSRDRPCPGDHPSRRQTDRAHFDSVPDQHAGHPQTR